MNAMRQRLFIALMCGLLIGVACSCGKEINTPTPGWTPTETRAPVLPSASSTATATESRLAATPSRTPLASATLPTTATPTAPATATPKPTETLSRLLGLLKELDLGLSQGNLYQPTQGALDKATGLIYLLGATRPGRYNDLIGVADPGTRQLLTVRQLPGQATGPLAAHGGRAYLTYDGPDHTGHLLALVGPELATASDVPLDAPCSALAVDGKTESLILAYHDRLETRDSRNLSLLASASYGGTWPAVRLATNAARRQAFVGWNEELRAYDLEELTLRWQHTFKGRIAGLTLDAAEQRLIAHTELWQQAKLTNLLETIGTDGSAPQTLSLPPEAADRWWSLLGADQGLVYFWESGEGGVHLVALDKAGRIIARSPLVASYERAGFYDAARQQIHVSVGPDHLLRTLDIRNLHVSGDTVLGIEVRDVAIGSDRIYVNDSAGRVTCFDLAHYERIGGAAAGRGKPLVLDETRARLYVPVEREGLGIAVLDTATWSVVHVITDGNRVALDTAGGRAFVGIEPRDYVMPAAGLVRVVDAASWRTLGLLSRGGVPTYNPVRNEIYVTDNSIYIYDGTTYAERGELTPDIGAQPLRGCSGCQTARGLYVFPEFDLLVADVTVLAAGKGPGIYPPPRFFSLETLTPLTYPVAASLTCAGKMHLTPPIDGILYTEVTYARYVSYQNLVAREAGTGTVHRWRDGLGVELVVPATEVIYSALDESSLLALDARSWRPLGRVPRYCFHTLDLTRGRLYATDVSKLLVLADRGGQSLPPPPPQPATTLGPIRAIYIAPSYSTSRAGTSFPAIFLDTDNGLLRSTDGGSTWIQLDGELAWLNDPSVIRTIAFSPDYAKDHTLFVGAYRGSAIGHGVLRSRDGGDSWELCWEGLDHLRIDSLVLSPRWAEDETIVAYAQYQKLAPTMQGGESVFRSTDRGDHWQIIATRTTSEYSASPLPSPEELLGIPRPLMQLKISAQDYKRSIIRTEDAGVHWTTVLSAPEGESFIALDIPPEGLLKGAIVYALSERALFRSRDRGDTWETAADLRVADLTDYGRTYRAIARLPNPDGSHLLLLGNGRGDLLRLAPESLRWERLQAAVPTPTTTASLPPTPVPTPVSPPPTATPPPSQPPPTLLPTPCAPSPAPLFLPIAEAFRDAIGCPLKPAESTFSATQRFQRGRMFWRGDVRLIYVLSDSGHWLEVSDTWDESQPAYDAGLTPPDGLLQPVRGFGKVWREVLHGPQADIGWAVKPEVGYQGLWQLFEGGLLLTDDQGVVHILRYDLRIQP